MTRRGLGRGLDALLASTEEGGPTVVAAGGREVDIDDIRPNPFQPRQHVDEGSLAELAASVKAHGLIQPLLVKADGEAFTIIAGERRWRAARLAGLTRVPVVVREATDQQMLALAIIENVQRINLNAIEAAEGYRRLIDSFGLTQSDVAELIGKSRPAVANTMRLLALPDDVRTLVAEGQLAEGRARALLAVTDADVQRAVARRAIAGAWTVRRVEHEVGLLAASGAAPRTPRSDGPDAPAPKDADTAAAERDLEQALGTRVEIRRRGEGGQVVVHFYSEEELNALYERLLGRP